MMGMMKMGLVGVMVTAMMMQTGCSFLFVSGPPANHQNMTSFDCSESNTAPVLDTIWASLNALGAISAAGDNKNANQGQIVAVGLGWLALSGASAIYGYTKVSKCKAAQREHEERYANGDSSVPPPSLTPPPPEAVPVPAPAGAPSPAPATRPAPPTDGPASPTSSLAPARTAPGHARSHSLAMRPVAVAD